jgi:hypothetical protein
MIEYIIGFIVTIIIIFIAFFTGKSRPGMRPNIPMAASTSAKNTSVAPLSLETASLGITPATTPATTPAITLAITPETTFDHLNKKYEDKIVHLEGPQDLAEAAVELPQSKHTSRRKVRFSSRRKERIIDRSGKIIDRVGKT